MLRDTLAVIRIISIPAGAPEVVRVVAEELRVHAAPRADLRDDAPPAPGTLVIRTAPAPGTPVDGAWMFFRVSSDGSGLLAASHPHHLYALGCLLLDAWLDDDASLFAAGRTLRPAFPWLRHLSDFLVGSLRFSRHLDRDSAVRDMARAGFTHITVNGLGADAPFETGPPGDVYSWFYDYSPDLDQFVTSPLLQDTFPAEYRAANVRFLREMASRARRYGLVPGVHINSPRSMPESFWERYPHLRGPRVDHPRESFRPRYALTLAHPAVREHYRVLVREIVREVPDLGFVHLWTNDSGAGFEFVSTLYAGRNGGPYLIREWKDPASIARAASDNVLRYLCLLLEEGKRARPDFRVICDLGPFAAERAFLLPGFGDGLDAGEFAFFEQAATAADLARVRETGAWVHEKVDLTTTNVIGIPFPELVAERLKTIRDRGGCAVLASLSPSSLAPFDINAEVLRAVQLGTGEATGKVLDRFATRWAGPELAPHLRHLWALCDHAVRAYPEGIPMSTFAFPWFRLWIRPFVPDINAIPEEERRYYERFLLATFNNPARVDLNNDMLWNFLSVREAGEKRIHIDHSVLPKLEEARTLCATIVAGRGGRTPGVFEDLLPRIRAARCYYATMRNTMAWTESVHGYLRAQTDAERDRSRALCRAMVDNERDNASELLDLWSTTSADVFPVSTIGETLHSYGDNLGDHLVRKISLMDRHRNDEPSIDPDYMWKMP